MGGKLEGKHVRYILGKVDPKLLRSVLLANKALTELIDAAGMRILGEPHVYDVRYVVPFIDLKPEERRVGVVGVAVLSTSHVSIMTVPETGLAYLDVFSCRDFDTMVIERKATELFQTTFVKTYDLSYSLIFEEE
jgi:S-adenosylmethionine/arginine decarboxylase-like enzyme